MRLKDTITLVHAASVTAARAASPESERAKLQLDTFRFLNGGIRFQQGVLGHDPDEAVNIEQIAVAAEQLHKRLENPISPYASGWHTRIVELERQCPDLLNTFADFIYSQLDRWLSLTEENIRSLHYIRNIFEICNDGCGIDIFSLNYDLCIETALTHYAKKQFANGFTESGGWEPQTLNENIPIRLFKLHGSLDWMKHTVFVRYSTQGTSRRKTSKGTILGRF